MKKLRRRCCRRCGRRYGENKISQQITDFVDPDFNSSESYSKNKFAYSLMAGVRYSF